MVEFEYDLTKSQANLIKHGIDFEEAKDLWRNNYIEWSSQYKTEDRFYHTGSLNGKF